MNTPLTPSVMMLIAISQWLILTQRRWPALPAAGWTSAGVAAASLIARSRKPLMPA